MHAVPDFVLEDARPFGIDVPVRTSGQVEALVLAGLFGEALLQRGEEWLAELEALMKAEIEAEGES